jgi:hypothetical protein
MKRIITLTFAATALALAACQEEAVIETPQSGDLTPVVLTAGWDESTRVTLGTGLRPEWEDGDAIAIYDGTGLQKFTISSNNGTSATFTGSMDTSAGTWYAAYPYDAVTGFSSSQNRFITCIPSAQTVAAGDSLDTSALISTCAFTDPDNLYFLQAASLVKFTVSTSGITQVELNANGSEYLAADVVQIKASEASIKKYSSYSSKVTMTHASGSFPIGNYYFAVVPNTFASGLTMTISTASASASVSNTSSVTAVQGGGINLGDVTSGISMEDSKYTITSDDAGNTTDEDVVDNTTFVRKIYVTYSSSGSATVTGAGSQAVTISGNDVTIDNTATGEKVIYELSGTTTDGFFKVYSANKQAIILNGVSITNKAGAAINNQGKKRCFVVVKGSNTLKDGSSYTDTPSGEDEKAAFFSEGQLIFSGSGSLSVTASGKSGITSDDYVRIMSSPTINVTSTAAHGLRGQDYVQISNGTLSVTTTTAQKKGINSDGYVLVEGGNTTITTSGGTAYDSDDGEYHGTAGIKADNYFAMTGGTVTINNSGAGGKGIRAGSYELDDGGNLIALSASYMTGGTLTITTTGSESNDVACKAIKIGYKEKVGSKYAYDGDFNISGGTMILKASKSETMEVKGDLTISGGEVYAWSNGDDAINSMGEMNITGGYVYGYATQNDAIDANCDLKISGGYVYAITTKGAPEVALDANTEGGYKLYIYSGATVVAYGGLESGYSSQNTFYSMSATAGAWNAMLNTSSSVIAAFYAPSGYSNYAVSAPSLSTTAKKGVTVNSSYYKCNSTWATSASGGSSVTLSKYTQQGGQGGNGHGPEGGR